MSHEPIDPAKSAQRALRVGGLLLVAISIALVGLLGRVAQLQTRPTAPIAELIGSQVSKGRIEGRRGLLTDRKGRPLAVSRTATRLFADPKLIDDPADFARIVADLLGYDAAKLAKKINEHRKRRYVVIDHRLSVQRLAAMAKLKLPGLATQRWVVRDYPHGTTGGQLLGAVGFEGHGLEGLEYAFESELSAAAGAFTYERDAARRPLRITGRDYRQPRDGSAIRLTIDLTVQSIAEQQLAGQCRKYDAEQGQLIVMEPATGHVLAMANYPPFDPNKLADSPAPLRRNRCVTDTFEPGSAFKPFIWAAAVEGGFIDPSESFDCSSMGLWVSPKGRRIRDVRGHGVITAEQILILSSNPGMAQVGLRMGAASLYDAVRAFGFGARSGSGLPGETTGIVHSPARWNHYSVTSVPMGQEVAVTGMQMVRAMSAIANDGWLPCPVLRYDQMLPVYEHVISAETARLTRQVLRRVVTEGTGRKAASKLYTIFGKTGTAQIADLENGGYLQDKYVGSFIGGAPIDQPRIVVGCFISKTDKSKGYYGGIISAPAVKQVIEKTLVYLQLPPDAGPEQAAALYAVNR